MNRYLKLSLAAAATVAVGVMQPSYAQDGAAQPTRADIEQTLGFVPEFFDALPEHAIDGFWAMMKQLELNPDTALDGKTKELIGLAVAAQIPCQYCVYSHLRAARANGASDEEIREAVAMAALTRMGSTVLNGLEVDMPRFQADIDQLMATN